MPCGTGPRKSRTDVFLPKGPEFGERGQAGVQTSLFMLRPSHFPGEGRRWGEAWTVGGVAWGARWGSARFSFCLGERDIG